MCRQEEWETIPLGYFNNTWAFVKESGFSRQLLTPSAFTYIYIYIYIFEVS